MICSAFLASRVGVAMLRQSDEGLPNCPTSCTLPSRCVERDLVAEGRSACPIEECISNGQIARRIADAHASEVDHRSQPAFFH